MILRNVDANKVWFMRKIWTN